MSDCSSGLLPGTRVVLTGLQFRADLNGTVAVILRPTHTESETLKSNGRVKLTGWPQPLSLKPENLRILSKDERPVDWAVVHIPGAGPLSISDLLWETPLGAISNSSHFIKGLMEVVSQGKDLPFEPFTRELVLGHILNDTTRHNVHFCLFDCIGHHLVLETYEGKAHLFQSLFSDPVRECGADQFLEGYTAQEWASDVPVPIWTFTMKGTHRRWGGGKEIDFLELQALLRLLFELQRQAHVIGAAMFSQVPSDIKKQESTFSESDGSSDPSPLVVWVNGIVAQKGYYRAYTIHDGAIHITSTEAYPGPSWYVDISASLTMPFAQTYSKVTGAQPKGFVFLMILRHHKSQPPGEGSAQLPPAGWAHCAVTIQH